MNERLNQALLAMDRLNSFARTQEGAGPRRAIYWLKARYAIRDAIMAGLLVRMRAIQVTTVCRRCRKGVYYDWDGDNRGPCYTCNGSGKVMLKFIETTIETRQQGVSVPDLNSDTAAIYRTAAPFTRNLIWHSPVEYSSWLGWPTDDLQFEESQDWTTCQPGKPMSAIELATAMNIVETYWPWWRKHSPYELSRDEYDSSRYYLFNYALDLGRSPEGCVLCGGKHHQFHNFTVAPGLTRAVSVCEPCAKREDIWKVLSGLPLPELDPEIQKWRARHAIQFESSWGRHWTDPWIDRRVEEIRGEIKERAAEPQINTDKHG